MIRALKAMAIAAVTAGGLTLGAPQDAGAQGFSLSVGRGGFYGPGYGYGGYGYPGYGYGAYHGYGYPAYGYSSYGFRSGYASPGFGYAYPSYGYGVRRWDNDWDRGDWRRFNRRMERRFDWDD